VSTVAFKGEDYSPPIKTKIPVKSLDPPDRFGVVHLPEVLLVS
jgi:hypothetical protein